MHRDSKNISHSRPKIVKNSGCKKKIETCDDSLSEPNKNITFENKRQLNANDSNIDASSCSSITITDSSSNISHDSSSSSVSLHNEEFELKKSDVQENYLKLRLEGNLIPYRALINGSEHVFYAPIGGTVHLFYPSNEKIGHLYYADNDNAHLYYLTCGNTVHYYNTVSQTLVCTSEVIDGFMSLSSITTAHSANKNIVDKDISLSNNFQVKSLENNSSDQETLRFKNKVTLESVDLNIKVNSNNSRSTNRLTSLQTIVRKSMQNTNKSNGVSLPNQNFNDFKTKNESLRSRSHKRSESFMPISSKYLNENDLYENNARQQNKSNFISSLQSIAQNYSDPQHSPSKVIKLPSISKNNKNLNLKPRRSTSAKILEPKIIYTNLSPIPSPIGVRSKDFSNTILDDSSFIETSTNNIHTSSPKIYAENISDNYSNSKSFAIHNLTQSSPGQENSINIDVKNKARVKQLKSTLYEKHDNLTNGHSHQTLNQDSENIDQKAFEMSAQFDEAISPINVSFLQPCMQAVVNSLLQRLYLQQPNINFPYQPLNQTAEPSQYLNSQQQQKHPNCVHIKIKNLYVEPQQQHQHPG